MIIDNIKNKEIYMSVNPGFKAAFEFVEKCLADNLPEGKYPLDGEDYAIVQCYETKENISKFEVHRDYTDIQFVASGREYMECAEIGKGTVIQAYNKENDVEFFSAPAEVRMTLTDGDFAVFFPNDLHNPGLTPDTKQEIKKIIVKVKNK